MKCANINCENELDQYRIDAQNTPGTKRRWRFRFCHKCAKDNIKTMWKCKGCDSILTKVTHNVFSQYCSTDCRRRNSEYSSWLKRYQSGKYNIRIASIFCKMCEEEIPYVPNEHRGNFCMECKIKIIKKMHSKKCILCKSDDIPFGNLFCRNCRYDYKHGIYKNKPTPSFRRKCLACAKFTKNNSFCSNKCLLRGRHLYNTIPYDK